jgi:integrase
MLSPPPDPKTGKAPRPRSRNTVVDHQSALNRFCRFLRRKGWIDGNPFDLLERVKASTRAPRPVPASVVTALLKKANGHPLYCPILIAAHCGLRLTEIRRLRWRDIHVGPKGAALMVGGTEPTKSDSWRAVPLPTFVRSRLSPGRLDDLMFPAAAKRTWIRRLERLTADLPVFGEVKGIGAQWHALRSYCAIQKAMKGATLPQLMYELGWSSMQMAQRYINIAQAAGR